MSVRQGHRVPLFLCTARCVAVVIIAVVSLVIGSSFGGAEVGVLVAFVTVGAIFGGWVFLRKTQGIRVDSLEIHLFWFPSRVFNIQEKNASIEALAIDRDSHGRWIRSRLTGNGLPRLAKRIRESSLAQRFRCESVTVEESNGEVIVTFRRGRPFVN